MPNKMSFNSMLMMVISLVFITFILPIGLIYIVNIGEIEVVVPFYIGENITNVTLSDTGMDTVITLLTTLVPLSIAIGIIIYYIKFAQN